MKFILKLLITSQKKSINVSILALFYIKNYNGGKGGRPNALGNDSPKVGVTKEHAHISYKMFNISMKKPKAALCFRNVAHGQLKE